MGGAAVSPMVGIFIIGELRSMAKPASLAMECLSLTHQVSTTVATVIVIVTVEWSTTTGIFVIVIGLEITSRSAITVHLNLLGLRLVCCGFVVTFEIPSVLSVVRFWSVVVDACW